MDGEYEMARELMVTTGPDSVASESKNSSLEDFLLSLPSSGQRNRAVRYLNNIHSNFKVLVEEAGHIRDKIPNAVSRLESVKDNLDKWHRGTNLVIAGGSTASAIGMLFALLFAPATGGASLGFAVGLAGSVAAIGGVAADGLKQSSSRNEGNNIVEEIEKICKRAESAHKEFKLNSELFLKFLYELDPSLRNGLDENDMYQLSISFACTRLFKNGSVKQPRYLSVPASAALKPLQSLNALSKGRTITVTSAKVLLRTVTTATVKEGSVVRSVGAVAVRNPVISNAGFTAIKRCSTTAVNQGTKVLTTTTAVNQVGAVVIDVGDVTITKVTRLKTFITTTTKELAPVLSKVGLALTAVGIIFDIYSVYNTFSELINDTKSDASQQIADHIDQLQEIQEQVEQFFDYLQASQDENSALEH